jgi:hypothetical protein
MARKLREILERVDLKPEYRAGLSDKTAAARKAHWKKMDKLSDSDPKAYEPAPGDATAKTKLSKHTIKYKKMYGEEIIDEEAAAGLAAKAKKSGVSLSVLRKVYSRGVAAWNSGHRPGTTPQQWGMARVNSYITKGKGTYHGADKDLREDDVEEACWKGYTKRGMKKKGDRMVPNCVPTEETEIEEKYGKGYKSPWDKIEKAKPGIGARIDAHAKELSDLDKKYKQITDKDKKEVKECNDDCSCSCNDVDEDAKGLKSPSGGLTQKGRDYYNRKTGGHLKAPVTTEPSKLKKGSKSANRRKSFCARMGGMKKRLTSAKTANDPDSRINKALRKWNC